jgi:hypothetical protein
MNGLSKLGQAVVAIAFLVAIVGCSSSDVVGPQASSDNTNLNDVTTRTGFDGQSSYSYKYYGEITKYDEDARTIEFAGSDLSSTPLTAYIGKEVSARLAPGADTEPFSFKYVTVGTYATVFGDRRSDGIINAALIDFAAGSAEVDANTGAVAREGAVLPGDNFKYFGEVAKYDVDQRIIQFVGSDFSSSNLQVEIARDADLSLGPNRGTVAFDWKYVEVGSFITVSGVNRSGDRALVNFVEINPQTGELDNNGEVFFSSTAGDAASFKYYGQLAKIDVDMRTLQFVGSDLSSSSLTVEIGKDAELRFDASGNSIPFSFKYVDLGDYATVYGTMRSDGTVLADRIDLQSAAPSVGIEPNI